MLLPILIYGHPTLRKVSEDMWQTMEESDGVGLAAPQVGKNIRIFVVNADAFADIDPEQVFVLSQYVGDELEILDPYGGTLQSYGLCYESLRATLKKLVKLLNANT